MKAGKLLENFGYRRFQQKDDYNIVPDIILVIPNDFKRIQNGVLTHSRGMKSPLVPGTVSVLCITQKGDTWVWNE